MNVPRIKGSHNAMLSGIAAAEAAFAALAEGRAHDELTAYEEAVLTGDIARRLASRCATPSRCGRALAPTSASRSAASTCGSTRSSRAACLHAEAQEARLRDPEARARTPQPIAYPKPDGVLTFDRLTSVSFSGTNHEENQPVHLKLTDPAVPVAINLPEFAEPAQRYCPAAVYEIVVEPGGDPRFQINAQNCVHCKTCDIKDPSQNITWVCPEGGGGPNYAGM